MLKESPLYQPERKPQDLYTVPPNLLDPPLDDTLTVNFNRPELTVAEDLDELEQAYLASEEDQPVSEEILSYLKRRTRIRKLAERALATTLIFVATATSGYLHDVGKNRIAASTAQPSITEAYPALDTDTNKATVIYDGFNTFGARYFAKTLGGSIQKAFGGEGLAVQYNNAVLDAERIGNEVDETLEEKPHIDTLDFVFHSAGDVPGVDYMVNKVNTTWVPVETATLIAGPADYDSLTQATQDQFGTAEAFADVPYIEYSTFFRYILEMHFYEDALERNPIRTLDGINTRFANGDVTNNLFLGSQLKSVSNADVPGKILDTDNDKFKTIYNVAVLEGDDVVNGTDSAEKICAAVEEIGHICNIFTIPRPNGGHGSYYTEEGRIAYDKLFEEIARVNKPQLEEEWQRYSLYKFNLYQEESITFDLPK